MIKPAAPGAMSGIKERLQRLEDLEAIRTLTARYAWHITKAELDGVVALFALDGRFGTHRRDELKAFLERNITAGDRVPLVQNHLVDITGDTAYGRCVMFSPWSPQGPFCGFYEDRYVREHERWCFLERLWIPYVKP